MAFVLTLNFSHEINTSVQIGDNVYHSVPNSSGGFDVIDNNNPPVHVGTVYGIPSPFELQVLSTYANSLGTPYSANMPVSTGQGFANGSFISFSKNGVVNRNELTGYYASVKLVNDSKVKAELFSAASEVTENSK